MPLLYVTSVTAFIAALISLFCLDISAVFEVERIVPLLLLPTLDVRSDADSMDRACSECDLNGFEWLIFEDDRPIKLWSLRVVVSSRAALTCAFALYALATDCL